MIPKRFLIVGVLSVMTATVGVGPLFSQVADVDSQHAAADDAVQQATTAVTLRINYGDQFEKHYTSLPWSEGITLLQAMQQAETHPHPLRFTYRGEGDTAFLVAIDGQENQGAGGANWIYYVNGQRGERGLGVKRLQSGDTILWSFEK